MSPMIRLTIVFLLFMSYSHAETRLQIGGQTLHIPKIVSLSERHGYRVHPSSVDQAFSRDYDVPAHLLNIDPSKLDRAWEREIREFEADPTKKVDVHSLKELNMSAAGIWQKILTCQQSDHEGARQAYLRGSGFCRKKLEDQKIVSELKELHQNTIQYVVSMEISKIKYDHRLREFAKFTGKYVPKEDLHLPLVHPLFSQVLIEHLSQIIAIPKLDQNAYDPYRMSIIMKYITGTCEQYSCQYAVKKFGFDKISARYFEPVKKYFLLIRMLSAIKDKKCQSQGLWPASAQSLITGLQFSFYTGVNQEEITALTKTWESACGKTLYVFANYYGVFYKKFLQRYRAMGRQYGLHGPFDKKDSKRNWGSSNKSTDSKPECSFDETWDESLNECVEEDLS